MPCWCLSTHLMRKQRVTQDSIQNQFTTCDVLLQPKARRTTTRLLQQRGTWLACSSHGAVWRRNAESELHWFLICTRAAPTSMILKMTLCQGTEEALLIQDCRAEPQEQILFGGRVGSWVVLRSWSRCTSACSPLSGPENYCSVTFRFQFLKMSSASQRRCARTVLPNVMTTSCASRSCTRCSTKSLGEIRHGLSWRTLCQVHGRFSTVVDVCKSLLEGSTVIHAELSAATEAGGRHSQSLHVGEVFQVGRQDVQPRTQDCKSFWESSIDKLGYFLS